MSNQNVSFRKDNAADARDVPPVTAQAPLATSYLPLWFLLAFIAVVSCGVLTK
jgi:hypothetical protein